MAHKESCQRGELSWQAEGIAMTMVEMYPGTRLDVGSVCKTTLAKRKYTCMVYIQIPAQPFRFAAWDGVLGVYAAAGIPGDLIKPGGYLLDMAIFW